MKTIEIEDNSHNITQQNNLQNILNEPNGYYFTSQQVIKFQKDWREKEFSNPNVTIKIGTMFSGIGAIEYALKRLNLKSEIQFASDIDNFAKQSYLQIMKLQKAIGTMMFTTLMVKNTKGN